MTTPNINDKSKMENGNGDIFKGTADIEFQRDWSIGLGVKLGNDHIEK